STWKYWNRPKIENRNGASEKTFSYTHLLRITSQTRLVSERHLGPYSHHFLSFRGRPKEGSYTKNRFMKLPKGA
ncbi:unnamed protein product, partial [Nesidiocoris tenuis]